MDDIKLYAAYQKQLDDLLNVTQHFSRDIHMEFGMKKCKVSNIEKGKIINGDVALPNDNIVQAMKKDETYKYLVYQQARLQDKPAKEKVKEEY